MLDLHQTWAAIGTQSQNILVLFVTEFSFSMNQDLNKGDKRVLFLKFIHVQNGWIHEGQ